MASYRKRGRTWRAELYVDGKRESQSFLTKAEAVAWATQREAELVGVEIPDKLLAEGLRDYARKVSPKHKGEKWELARLGLLARDKIAGIKLAKLKASDLSEWRDRRLREVSADSVAREMNLLKAVLEIARKEWGWLRVNPLKDVECPALPPSSRCRRINQNEIDRLVLAFGFGDGLSAETATQRTGLAFLFALETAMQSGEIIGLKWSDIKPKSVRLPATKNGGVREVPISPRAREIIAVLPRSGGARCKWWCRRNIRRPSRCGSRWKLWILCRILGYGITWYSFRNCWRGRNAWRRGR